MSLLAKIRDAMRGAGAPRPPADRTRPLRRQQARVAKLGAQIAIVKRQVEQLSALQREDADCGARLDRLEPILDPGRIGDHVRSAVRHASLVERPFPHLVIANLFPQDGYDAVLDAIPPPVFFADQPAAQLGVPPGPAPMHSIATWEFVRRHVTRAVLVPALVERFEQPFDRHLATLCPSRASVREAGIRLSVSGERLLRRQAGYAAPSRQDAPWEFLTTIIYLARAGDSEEYGTRLVDARHRAETNVPFRSNSAVAFFTPDAVYDDSVPSTAPTGTERYTYQFLLGLDKQTREVLGVPG